MRVTIRTPLEIDLVRAAPDHSSDLLVGEQLLLHVVDVHGHAPCYRETTELVEPCSSRSGVSEDAGCHRSTGLRAAAVSSNRPTRVRCGAVFTSSGFVSHSSAIARIDAMKRSSSSRLSVSVGSAMIAPAAMSGNDIVGG